MTSQESKYPHFITTTQTKCFWKQLCWRLPITTYRNYPPHRFAVYCFHQPAQFPITSQSIAFSNQWNSWSRSSCTVFSCQDQCAGGLRCLYANAGCASPPPSKWMWASNRVGVVCASIGERATAPPARCRWRALQRRESVGALKGRGAAPEENESSVHASLIPRLSPLLRRLVNNESLELRGRDQAISSSCFLPLRRRGFSLRTARRRRQKTNMLFF